MPTAKSLILICPFYVWDPITYHSCCRKKLRHNSDLRTHFHRCHAQPVFCPVCKVIFKGKEANVNRNAHIKDRRCYQSLNPDPAGLTGDHFDLIGQKKELSPFRQMNLQARQWYAIWDICFPGAAFPSPDSICHEGALGARQNPHSPQAAPLDGQSTRNVNSPDDFSHVPKATLNSPNTRKEAHPSPFNASSLVYRGPQANTQQPQPNTTNFEVRPVPVDNTKNIWAPFVYPYDLTMNNDYGLEPQLQQDTVPFDFEFGIYGYGLEFPVADPKCGSSYGQNLYDRW
ncbi:hypothetical protein QBC38DRAFT_446494 [Podospora fimiseda]|uniref:Uncharacterized protein n=1 Tax=Podospora fimiseda TaxID=252190 RepID=A0AAN7GX85_9PEZI|nr:hypothetical protein QBC38DRAFT_446494 [Podospora fimiseda]